MLAVSPYGRWDSAPTPCLKPSAVHNPTVLTVCMGSSPLSHSLATERCIIGKARLRLFTVLLSAAKCAQRLRFPPISLGIKTGSACIARHSLRPLANRVVAICRTPLHRGRSGCSYCKCCDTRPPAVRGFALVPHKGEAPDPFWLRQGFFRTLRECLHCKALPVGDCSFSGIRTSARGVGARSAGAAAGDPRLCE